MAAGVINSPPYAPLAGLSTYTANNEARLYTPFNYPREEAGYITKTTPFLVFLYNGGGSNVVISSVAANADAEGMTTDVVPGKTIKVGMSTRVIVTISDEGPLVYEAVFTFVSACSFDPFLVVSGTRAPKLAGNIGYLFVPHNWENGFEETLAWMTDVLIAHDRTEQRVQMRTMPRRTWEFNFLAKGSTRRLLENVIASRTVRNYFSPVWRDAMPLEHAITSGDTSVLVDHVGFDYAVDRWVAVWSSDELFEIKKITSVQNGVVGVETAFSKNWSTGAMIAPARYCLLIDPRKVSRYTGDTAKYYMSARVLNEGLMDARYEPETYLGLHVCPFKVNWASCEDEVNHKWETLDNDTGLIEYDIQSAEPILSRNAGFLIEGRTDIDNFLRFLFERSGRLTPFWMSTEADDMKLVEDIAAGSKSIVIENIDYERSLKGNSSRSHFEIALHNGTVIRRKITDNMTLASGDEAFSFADAIVDAIAKEDVARVSWLELARFDADSVTIKWANNNVLESEIPVIALP